MHTRTQARTEFLLYISSFPLAKAQKQAAQKTVSGTTMRTAPRNQVSGPGKPGQGRDRGAQQLGGGSLEIPMSAVTDSKQGGTKHKHLLFPFGTPEVYNQPQWAEVGSREAAVLWRL